MKQTLELNRSGWVPALPRVCPVNVGKLSFSESARFALWRMGMKTHLTVLLRVWNKVMICKFFHRAWHTSDSINTRYLLHTSPHHQKYLLMSSPSPPSSPLSSAWIRKLSLFSLVVSVVFPQREAGINRHKQQRGDGQRQGEN